jgi:hypothetical protein
VSLLEGLRSAPKPYSEGAPFFILRRVGPSFYIRITCKAVSPERVARAGPSKCSLQAAATGSRAIFDADGVLAKHMFNNVEIVIAQQIGTQTMNYVRNIYEYYLASKLSLDAQAEAEKSGCGSHLPRHQNRKNVFHP